MVRALGLLLVASLLVVAAPAAPSPAGAPAQTVAQSVVQRGPASVTLEGRGYGHGRGMSQYGAQGAASERGKTHRQILRFYYPGLAFGTAGGTIRVLITADSDGDVVVGARRRLAVRSVGSDERFPLTSKGAKRWRITPIDGGSSSRVWVLRSGWKKVRDLPGAAQFEAGGRPIELFTPAGAVRYRGALRSAGPGSDRATVNVLDLDPYLRGVVPREVPALWHPEAVRAQSIAARTYAAYERAFTDRGHFDVYDTTQSQVYGGRTAEHPASDDAVRATAGVVLTDDGEPAFTQFSSSNGGWTVAGTLRYQVAKEDVWDPWAGNPNRTWTTTVAATAIERAYPAIGDFRRLRVVERDGHGAWNGRALRVRVVGARASRTVDATDLRVALGLKSTWFRQA
ncbi:SpoIID/LytB domain-containing protein [Nocardioides stalactiti]|uniref:SpoIID/LytB domain-containing protein n=1 Tax=Nocardioides stalactiti TaxID=2755356 RepID=UPI001602CA6C|nr:SpoIID/LytB domain-containing protein [Nocardioides stalactiti]